MANSQIDIKRLSFPNADAQLLLGLKGDKGDTGDRGEKGDTGDTGNGIASITHTGTSGAVKTYTITFTDGTSQTYDVTDGQVTTEQMDTAIDNAVTDVKSELTDETNARILLAGRMTTAEGDIDTLETHKVAQPLDEYNQPTDGTDGQSLRTKGNGRTEWADVGLPTDAQTAQAVSDWLNDHPEATTTVQDGSLTESKLANALKLKTIKDYFTPQMFGAVADGVADDTVAIQEALDYAGANNGVVYIPEGEYRITDTLLLKYSNVIIYGAGQYSKITKDFNGNMIQNANGYVVTDVIISDIYLFGNDKDGNGIYTERNLTTNTRCGAIYIQRVTVTRNNGVGIYLKSNYIAKIVDCNVYNNGTGIEVTEANGTTIQNNEIFGNEYGIVVGVGSFACNVIGNTIQANTICSVLFGSCYACSVKENYFESNTGIVIWFTNRAGIDGDSPSGCQISNNYIACDGDTKAIFIEYGSHNGINDNFITCGTQDATIYFGANSNDNNVAIQDRRSANATNLVSDLGYYNMFQPFVVKEVTETPDVNGFIDTGLKWSDYVVVGVFCTNRTGWYYMPYVDNSSSSLNASNWLVKVYLSGATPSGSYTLAVFAIKRTVFRTP